LPELSPHETVVNMLNSFYAVMGHAPEVVGAINQMAADLLEDGCSLEQIAYALRRCKPECKYPVRLPHIFERIPGREVSREDAEIHAAWDITINHVRKWGRWAEDYAGAYIEKGAPVLPDRITDTVRRTGGWGAYLVLGYSDQDRARDAAFQRERFFDEYKAWTAIDRAVPNLAQLLNAKPEVLALAAKPMESPKEIVRKEVEQIVRKAKRQTPLTDSEVLDRKEMLKQQAQSIAGKVPLDSTQPVEPRTERKQQVSRVSKEAETSTGLPASSQAS
jgi:hypothetical protein